MGAAGGIESKRGDRSCFSSWITIGPLSGAVLMRAAPWAEDAPAALADGPVRYAAFACSATPIRATSATRAIAIRPSPLNLPLSEPDLNSGLLPCKDILT